MIATVRALLVNAGSVLPASGSEPQILLGHVLQRERAWLIAHDKDEVGEADAAVYRALVQRRLAGEPIAYLVGHKEFHGLDFRVTPDVLIPRPETETLVDLVLEILPRQNSATVLDLGTGSGCIAVSIAHERSGAQVTAIDASPGALDLARANAKAHRQEIEFLQGEWYAPVKDRAFDVIVSNPPYVADGDPHLRRGDLRFEPQTALVAGADGLGDIHAIVQGAPAHLKAGGWLLFEHGHDQAVACKDLLTEAGFQELISRADLAGIERVAGGRLLTSKSAYR
ncbi:MAG TPA: peptide chain release factor N(5)-glutamine methyltransferase [Burkholderiales bacterium]|nr:peptide chain release factor N(5)-glutamine methyltransferase [Burkholderiales bacterium]